MQTITLLDSPAILIGSRTFRFPDRQTATIALTEYASAYWQKSPQDAIKVIETIAGNKYGAEISSKE